MELILTLDAAALRKTPRPLKTAVDRALVEGILDGRQPFEWHHDYLEDRHSLWGSKPAAAPTDPVALKPDFNTGLVSMLTELLRRAQAGEINQVALVFTEPGDDHKYGTWISDRAEGSTLFLIGAIADLQFTALSLHNEQQKR